MTDLDIAKKATLQHITKIAEKFGIDPDEIEMFGKYKAKLPLHLIDEVKANTSNLILVSAISPTPAGEGKTTMSIGLSEALNQLNKKTTVVLREPSLGPVFGIKGGATGGGHAQVLPMEDINLHFTGDFSAIEKAHNLLSALIDNNLQSKTNSLGIDGRTVGWKRVMDMNDRALRNIVVGLGGTTSGIPRETGFDITAASEIMAILCLCSGTEDLKERIARIFIGYTYDKKPVYARDLNAQGAMAALYAAAHSLKLGNYASEHDILIAKKVASVLCGGDLSGVQKVSEQYLLDIEREAFLSLCGEVKTMERIQHMLEKNKPLRN